MNQHIMPDIASKANPYNAMSLDWVGMSDIELPVYLIHDNEAPIRITAKVQAYVNLEDPNAKGIPHVPALSDTESAYGRKGL